MKTLKQHALWAWSNVSANDASPLLLAIGEAIKEMPDDDQSYVGQRFMRRFAERIGKPGEHQINGISCLDYSTEWTGEWYVNARDLEAWGLFRMWGGRIDGDSQMLSMTFQDISRAMKCKRLYQAYERYQATGLTKDHCALLAHMLWEMDLFRGDWISLFVQGKRPFGNSSITYDIFEHAGWPMDWPEDDGMSEEQAERAWNLFDELVFAAPDAAKAAASSLITAN